MKNTIKELIITLNYYLTIAFIKRKHLSFKSILVIAPHPDDEIIGLGGLILQTLEKKGKVTIVYLSDGENSGIWEDKEEIKKQRIALTEKVCKQIQISTDSIYRFHLADGEISKLKSADFQSVVKRLCTIIEDVKPEAVFATHELDFWPYDHVACANLTKEAIEKSGFKPQLYFYWVWAWYHLKPWNLYKINFKNLFKINIQSELSQKQKLMNMYLEPLAPNGNPWSGMLPKAMLFPFKKPFEIIEKYNN